MSYKAVFLDIDGTMLPHRKSITNTTKQAVQKLKDNGIHVVVATGRAPYFAMPIIQDLHIPSAIFFNGSYVEHRGEVLHQQPIEKSILEKLHVHTSSHQHPLTYLAGTECRVTEQNHPFVKEAFQHDPWQPDLAPATFWQEQDIYQMFLHCDMEEERLYEERIPELHFRRWSDEGMRTCDVNAANLTKAAGILKILEQLQVAPEEAAAFGDGLNDIEMLSLVGMGVAMGNARQEVKQHADLVTLTAEEDGVVHGLKKLGLI
ncbi:Cof-type HAD-IIB family hydrolase [Ectobacillus ponti]|uniref:Cof-type HAD-IIB family hydrolase n=1 Tax=Ectobacillus ponti TaxID=2961894 RepID=A0AA41X7I9_9BACI|nr:Cof-type HAD-IIB family hydrolase [Ectobacillus ponti]MCP8968089.1 Cof-type HAD-IIB family hydrolase [Ectobacillus ponti]